MVKLSVIIPSASDPCLEHTVEDIREHARGDIEIIAVEDGGRYRALKGAKVLHSRERQGMRPAINQGVAEASGDVLMKCDAHCSFCEGFDQRLVTLLTEATVVIPRRYRLDIERWEPTPDPPIDYERIEVTPEKLHGVVWTNRGVARAHLPLDDDMVFQGSCWVMPREHWLWLGGLQTEGYGTFTQEPMEIALKTWLGGRRVVVNKLAWYAHKHRRYKRTWHSLDDAALGNRFSRDYWVNNRWAERRHDFEWLFRYFGRTPPREGQ